MMRPNISLRPVARRRACTFLKYLNSRTASKTLCRVSSEIYSLLLSTRETVASDTPARLATSRIVWAIVGSLTCLDGETYHDLVRKATRLDKADPLGYCRPDFGTGFIQS